MRFIDRFVVAPESLSGRQQLPPPLDASYVRGLEGIIVDPSERIGSGGTLASVVTTMAARAGPYPTKSATNSRSLVEASPRVVPSSCGSGPRDRYEPDSSRYA